MFTLHDRILRRAGALFTALCAAVAFCAGSATDAHAQPAPANNNLTSAQAIIGPSGSIQGNNQYATAQTGEPAPYPGNPAQASIWYIWTAPISGTIDFNTRGSSDPNTGDDLDTVLAVYSFAGTNLSFANLTPLAENDDDPSGGVVSRVDVPVTVGTTYLIQVDGSINTPNGSNAQGNINLNWYPSLVGGNFGFSTSTYFAGDLDDEIPVQEITHSTAPSLVNTAGTSNVRITVARQGGYTGKCEVTLSVTNITYFNEFITNRFGTNIYTTNYNLTGGVINFTNTYYTNIASENLIQEYINFANSGFLQSVQIPIFGDYSVSNANLNGFITTPFTNNLAVPPGLTNYFTNFPCAAQVVTNGPTTNGSIITITVTQVFCLGRTTNFSTTVSASNKVDYVAVTTNLTFDDFQMSKDFYVSVNPSNTILNQYGGIGQAGPDWPDANSNFNAYGVNALVLMSLSNPMLDSNEDLDITPPTITPGGGSAYLDILNFNGNPNNYIGSSQFLTTNSSPSSYVTINLERATFRCSKGVGTLYLYAVLSGPTVANATYTVHYTIDCAGIVGAIGTPNSAFNWNGFTTVADSDYAVPSYYGVTAPDFGIPINTPNDPSGFGVGGKTTWPAGQAYIGSFTIGPFPAPIVGEIAIPIFNNGAVEFDMDFQVELFETVGDAQGNSTQKVPGIIGNLSSANVTINFAGAEPGGANDVSFNGQNNNVPGASGGQVEAVAIQPNGQAVIGGYFTSYNAPNVYGITRLLTNGVQDPGFNNVLDGGVNGYVRAIAIDANGKIIIGGSFTSYDGVGINAVDIARLNTDGSLDQTFNTGVGFGTTSTVYALAIDGNGNILVGGDFTKYNTTNCSRIVRLLPSGGLDTTFLPDTGNGNPNYGTDNTVRAVATDGNGNIVLGGLFTHVNGTNLNYLARLLTNGTVDPTFNPEIGPDGYIYSVAVEPDNEIVIGGGFQNYNLVSRSCVALVNAGGSLDTSFAPGTGADGVVNSVALQPNGDVLVGGQFRNFNGSRRLGVARLLPQGWVDTSFMDTSYNQYAGLINTLYNDPVNTANALALQPDGNIIVGGSFTRVGGGTTRDAIQTQINVARLIGTPTVGPQTGGGGIGNDPGNITMNSSYSANDSIGKFFVNVNRTNGSLGPAQFTLGTNTLPPGPGSASATDFGIIPSATAFYNVVYNHWLISPAGDYAWRLCDGYYGDNNKGDIRPITDFGDATLYVAINDDKAASQNLFASLSELNINAQDLLQLGGVSIPLYPALGIPSSPLEIVNDNISPGVLGFSATNYVAVNTSNSVTLTVLRTNGNAGSVSVYYYTQNGTAVSNNNYIGTGVNGNTQLSFTGQASDTSATFTIPILNTGTLQSNKTFKVILAAASYSGAFDTNVPPVVPSNTVVTIIDGNFQPGHLSFTSPTFSVLKGGLATVTVQRTGGAKGQLQVQCGTSNGTGTNGINYTGITTNLFWGDQDISNKTMIVQTLQDNIVEGPKTVNLSLFNPTNIGATSNNANLILTSPSNAVLTVEDIDNYGSPSFLAPNFNVSQDAGLAVITVVRTNGFTGTISVNYATFNDSNAVLPYLPAQAGTNYSATSGVLTLGPGITSTNFIVPIIATPNSAFANRIVTLELFNGSPPISNQFATLTILDPNLIVGSPGTIDMTTLDGTGVNNGFNAVVDSLALQPDGSVLAGGNFTFVNKYPFEYVARLQPNGAYDSGFLFDQAGANGPVLQVLSQAPGSNQVNGRIMVAGSFTQIDNVVRGGIARLNLDGSIDETFNPGSGADSTIFALAQTLLPTAVSNQSSIAYYVAGNFANFNGVPSGGITRLNASTNSPGFPGTVDPNFNPGAGVTGGNAAIHALAVQPNLQVVAGGDFTAFNSVTHNHLVRLNVDGSVDATFNPSTGSDPTGSIRAVAIQPDGRIVIGGSFTNVNGSNYNRIARLNTDGSLDTNFNVGVGGDNTVFALAIDSQSRILVGGEFSRFSGVTRSGITRLNSDGTVDPTINFGSGADGGFVNTIVVDTNDEIDVGGGFSTFEGIAENNFVRLYGGAIFGEGTIQFSQGTYGVMENATNAAITIQRFGGEGTATQPTVSITFSTSDGTAVAGSNYTSVTTNVTFPYGETFQTVLIPIINSQVVDNDKIVNLNLSDPVFALIGSVASAQLIITNANTAVSFTAQTYRQAADAPGSNAIVSVSRIGNPNSVVGVTVYTGTNGTARPNVDYSPTTNFLVFNSNVMTLDFLVPLLNAPDMLSDQTVDLEMNSPSNAFLGSPSSATLTISSVFTGPGTLAFSQPSYTVSEGATNAVITLIRTNGSSSNVWVTLTTSNGTATAGINYSPVQTVVNFGAGETNETVNIPVIQQAAAGPDTTVFLILSNPGGGATIGGPTQEVLTIQNDIENFSFTNSPYFVGEGGSITIDVVRSGPSMNAASVGYATFSPPNASEAAGEAVPNVDYTPVSGTLNFVPNETFTTFSVATLQGNVANGPLTFQVLLNSPSPAGVQIGSPGAASVTILSDVTGFEFATNAYAVGENGSNIVITVTRVNFNTGAASVQFATSDGTALNHIDYLATNGVLNFANGQTNSTFTVTILNQNIVENNKTFNVTLSNPLVTQPNSASTNAYLLSPSNATVTITNVLTGVSFESPTYTVSECGFEAAIPVVLTGVTNGLVSVSYNTTNGGSALPGTNYFATNGSLVFSNGQTVQTIFLQVINNHIIGPDHTVVLNLFNPQPQGVQLLNPSTAVLTIQECNGAYIVKSGTAFVSGSTPNNGGVIFPNETVSLLFGLRDVAGNSTTNLVATLLATNGVTNVSSAQNYGALTTGGPTVARPFTFKAVGTNGQNISATLSLMDGSQVYSNVIFGFTLGGGSNVFSTNETLFLVGSNNPPSDVSKAFNSNPPNFGYPSVINVSGVVGNVVGVTATVSNFGHSFPSDVAMVLKAPEGQYTTLMDDCGSDIPVNNVNLTFSQSAGGSLPQSSTITSGTYLPTSYGTVVLPATNGAPAAPYPVNMNNLIGQSPNGAWSLYVADENVMDGGYISNGWSLNISTGIPVEQDSDLETAISISPASATLSNILVYTISVTNYGPSAATNVIITDTLPAGVTYVSNSCNCTAGTNGMLTYTASSLAVSNGVTLSFAVVPNALGYITNIASAIANQPDPNSNNVQTNVTLIGPVQADLAVTLSSTPNPVLDGANVTYNIVVTNNGPSLATGVTVVNTLPAEFLPFTITPTTGTASNVNGTITWNVGSLGYLTNSSASMTIIAAVNLPENGLPSSANLDQVSVSSPAFDPAKANNHASVKTEVLPAMITVTPVGKNYMLSWPVVSGNIILQGSIKLPPTWVSITNSSVVPQLIGGQMNDTYTLPGTNGYHFFRLKSQLP